ncbi:MAG TPA: serine hydrolase [Thermoanaerobaculia bacterium]|nr:serine hydrolase [Thermoanaerobaculia bacterium]
MKAKNAKRESIAAEEVSLFGRLLHSKGAHDLEDLGVAFYDYESTVQWCYNADDWFHAASTMKLAVLMGVFRQIERGELTLDSPVHVRNRFTSIVNKEPFSIEVSRDGDSNVFKHLGKTLPVRELAYWMITTSSNLATNLLVDIVSVEAIQHALDELGISGVKLLRGVEDQAAYEAGLNNEVTANGLLRLLRVIAEKRAFSPSSSQEMLDIMLDQRYRSGIPAGLPQDAKIAHKTGNISTVHHDAGIVYLEGRKPYVMVILTEFDAKTGRGKAVADISREVHSTLAELSHA